MRFTSLLIFLFAVQSCCIAQDFNVTVKEADRLEALPDEPAAFLKFKEALKLKPTDLYALTRTSELCCRIGGREKASPKLRQQYFDAALIYARTALRLYPTSDQANVAMAFAVGRSILLKKGKEKLEAAQDLKKYAEAAIDANPANFKAWHILARWNYEVSNLSGFERTAAKIMYGSAPSGTLKNAITYYEKARSLDPDFALNYLELAKAYNRNNEKDKALAQLRQVLKMRNKTGDDPRIKEEAGKLIGEWGQG